MPTRSLIWCVGVRADPLVNGLDLGTYRGRLDVDPYMEVPGAQGIDACGDCAAVPDLTHPGQICGMTARHATRQGRLVAGTWPPRWARDAHGVQARWLGLPVDLDGLAAAANPLKVPLSGPAANALTRGYHLYSTSGNRMQVLADWALNATTPAEPTSLAVISAESVPLNVDKPRA